MKKILFIHPFLCYPKTSGGHQALYNGIMAAKKNYKVYVAFMGQDDEAQQVAINEFQKNNPEVNLLPMLSPLPPKPSLRLRFIWKVRHALDRLLHTTDSHTKIIPEDCTRWWKQTITPNNEKWMLHLERIIAENSFDLVQIEMPWHVSDVYAIPKDIKKIYFHHELGFVRRDLEIKEHGSNIYIEAGRRFADSNEIIQLNMYDAIVTLSPIDKQKLLNVGVNVPIFNSFAIVDTEIEIDKKTKTEHRLTFIGPDNHTPNFIGITWFLENCWPILKCTHPDYTLDLIGLWNEDNKIAYSSKYPDIRFLGFVDNLYDTLKGSVMIVPITVGSGIRMKILEACSMRIPFVSTTVGAEGIPVENGKHCFLADDAAEFVNNIIRLEDGNLRLKLSTTANQMVKDKFSLLALSKNREDIYNHVLNNGQ